jgi:hypothetical protein
MICVKFAMAMCLKGRFVVAIGAIWRIMGSASAQLLTTRYKTAVTAVVVVTAAVVASVVVVAAAEELLLHR